MPLSIWLIATLLVLPALGLAAWSWRAMDRVHADLHSFNGFEGLHLER
ncbi:MAG: hypothetical protein Q7U26_17660 [Aquabacterium sp.]|nr:hypothetical protein [Aquabacterium sp.]